MVTVGIRRVRRFVSSKIGEGAQRLGREVEARQILERFPKATKVELSSPTRGDAITNFCQSR